MNLFQSSSQVSVSLRMRAWSSPEFVVTGQRYVNDHYEVNEIVHDRSEAIKLRNSLTKMLKATAPPPKKRKAA